MRGLDSVTWRLVSPLLDRALDATAGDRARLVAEVRVERSDLADLLDDLLAEHDRLMDEGFLGAPIAMRTPPATTLAGTVLGPYTLERPLGAGGMGSVWLARRSDGRFDGAVAVKLLHLGVLDDVGAERFAREGTVLARLSHPNIARLFDAGVTAAGQPYLVLEYVEGVPIDRHADARRLGVRARLDLFLQMADAVGHAHARLIVHRDIKPSNVLVDAGGQVKLLDFGVAKLLDPDRADADVTLAGRGWTPSCAAPEQVRGEPVTVAADVYALGVLLYRLLVDVHPTAPDAATAADHVRAIVEVEPPFASAAVDARQADAVRVASARATTIADLRRTLEGDLDNVLAKALRKAPEQRYASVGAFADDVRRYLRDEPVAARPDRWPYRARKFVRRHRMPVAAGVIVVSTLAAATAVTTERMFEARRQRDDAAYQARRAQASFEFMRSLVSQIGQTPVTMKTVLDRGRDELNQRYGDDPAFGARMNLELSSAYVELSDFATAAALRTRALETAKAIDDPLLLAEAQTVKARDLVESRDFAGARTHLAEARRLMARLRAPPLYLLVEADVAASELAAGEERFDVAIEHARRAVAALRSAGETRSLRFVNALHHLSYVYRDGGRFVESVRVLREVVALSRRIGKGRTVSIAVYLSNLGVTERRLGWWLDAERTLREALDLSRGIEASGRLPVARMQNYARVLVVLGRRAEGKAWLERALAEPGAASRFYSAGRLALASVLVDEGRLAEARAAFERAGRELPGPPTPPERAATALVQAQLTAAEGSRASARAQLAAAAAAEGYPGVLSALAPDLLEYGARLALQDGDHIEALRLARDAAAGCERHYGTSDPSAHTGRAYLTQGLALLAAGRRDEARAALERASALIGAAAGPDHPWAREARAGLDRLS